MRVFEWNVPAKLPEAELENRPRGLVLGEAPVPSWTTRDGRVIPLPELTDAHLRNIILYVHKTIGYVRGNNAPLLPGDPWYQPERDLRLEAQRRNLSWV